MNILAVVGKVLELGRLLLQPVIDDHYSGEVVIEVIRPAAKLSQPKQIFSDFSGFFGIT